MYIDFLEYLCFLKNYNSITRALREKLKTVLNSEWVLLSEKKYKLNIKWEIKIFEKIFNFQKIIKQL